MAIPASTALTGASDALQSTVRHIVVEIVSRSP